MVSGASETLTEGHGAIVVAGIVGEGNTVLVACGYVVSVVSGRGSGMVVVAGSEVATTTSGMGRGIGRGITDEVVSGTVDVVCGVAVVVGR